MSKRLRLWLALLCALLLVPTLLYGPSLMARALARRDVAHGDYHMTEYGLLAGDFRVYKGLLLQRYGVHVEAGGCMLPVDLSLVEDYNDIVRESLRRKYHHDIFAECAAASLPRRGNGKP